MLRSDSSSVGDSETIALTTLAYLNTASPSSGLVEQAFPSASPEYDTIAPHLHASPDGHHDDVAPKKQIKPKGREEEKAQKWRQAQEN